MPTATLLAVIAGAALIPAAAVAARAILDARLRRENLFLLHMHKGGLGDAFCQTGLMRALRAKHPGLRFVVLTRYPEFYDNLPEVARVADLRRFSPAKAWCVQTALRLLRPVRAHDFVYKPQRQTPKALLEARPGWRPHLVELASERLRLPADFSDVRGLIRFSPEEESEWAARHAGLGRFALIVPAGKTSYTPNKEWGFDNYRRLVGLLPGVNWVQPGLPENPALPGALDLRGRIGLREMAWLLSHAEFAVCGEGLHNHLCGALGTPCFVIFSGFHYPEIARYPSTVPMLAPKAPPCAPCWLKTPCPVPGKPCTGDITPESVAERIRVRFGDGPGRGSAGV